MEICIHNLTAVYNPAVIAYHYFFKTRNIAGICYLKPSAQFQNSTKSYPQLVPGSYHPLAIEYYRALV